MTELRRFRATDLLSFNPINLDRLTETYNLSFYLSYMATWPDLFLVQHSPSISRQSTLLGPSSSIASQSTSPPGNVSSHSTQHGLAADRSAARAPRDGRMMGYLMGKLEGRGKDWHSHVTAITVSPEYRRLGVARGMMQGFELSSDQYSPRSVPSLPFPLSLSNEGFFLGKQSLDKTSPPRERLLIVRNALLGDISPYLSSNELAG
jgi:N-terminal acetyltransferase B complex catalytic subunit